MLTIDTRPFKTDMHETLDRWTGLSPADVPILVAEIDATVAMHRIALDATVAMHRIALDGEYARQLSKIMLSGSRDRAGKLVDIFPDRALSKGGELFMRFAWLQLRLAVLVGIIWAVVWIVT